MHAYLDDMVVPALIQCAAQQGQGNLHAWHGPVVGPRQAALRRRGVRHRPVSLPEVATQRLGAARWQRPVWWQVLGSATTTQQLVWTSTIQQLEWTSTTKQIVWTSTT
jgi:hypothetical protein